jgi:D-glycero-D-manno-heptose 1,7-bisphosphate phosphatase
VTRRPLVIVDRDGVVNEDSAEYVKSVAEWRPIPGSLEALAALHRGGFDVAVVTNQSGVARGLFSQATLEAIHAHMRAAVEGAGGRLAAVRYCPHLPTDGCDCRKPRVGLLRALEHERGEPLVAVPFIGDRLGDVDAALAVGARPMLVRTGSGAETERALAGRRVELFDDLRAAAAAILRERTP